MDELWGEAPPPTAAKIVRNNVSLLRKELGVRLVTRPPGYMLVVEDGELDSARFERAIQSRTPDDVTAALALWRGPPRAFAYESFAQGEIARLEELRLVAIEARIDAELELGRHRALIPELETLVQQHPLRESLCSKLMLAYYRSGRQADALEAYRRARLRSSEELGIEPGPELRELERRILNHDESLAARPSPEQHPATARRRRRPFLVAAAAALVLASIAAVAAVAMRDDGGLSHVPPNYVGVIDPKTNDVVAAVPVGIRPGPVASSSTTVWVGNLTDRSITSIDPVTRTPARPSRSTTARRRASQSARVLSGSPTAAAESCPASSRSSDDDDDRSDHPALRRPRRSRGARPRPRVGGVRRLHARADRARHPPRLGHDPRRREANRGRRRRRRGLGRQRR